jgi:hypothetical protein
MSRTATIAQKVTAVSTVLIAICCVTTLALIIAIMVRVTIVVGSDEQMVINAKTMLGDSAHMLHTARLEMDRPDGELHMQLMGLLQSTHRFLANSAPLLEAINPEAVHNTTTWVGTEDARPAIGKFTDRLMFDLERAEDFLVGVTAFLARVRVDK